MTVTLAAITKTQPEQIVQTNQVYDRHMPYRQSPYDDEDVVEAMVQHEVHRSMRAGDRATGCVSWALLPSSIEEYGNLLACRDRGSRWLSSAFVPKGFLRGVSRDVFHVEARHTVIRYGMPHIGDGAIGSYDVIGGTPAVDAAGKVRVGGKDGVPLDDRRTLRAVIDMHWAALSSAFRFRNRWSNGRERFLNFIGDVEGLEFRAKSRYQRWLADFVCVNHQSPSREEREDNMLLLGGDSSSHVSNVCHWRWLPTPLLAFLREDADSLFDLTTGYDGVTAKSRVLSRPLLNAMADEIKHGVLPIRSPVNGVFRCVTKGKSEGLPCMWVELDTEFDETLMLRCSRSAVISIEAMDKVHIGQTIGDESLPLPCGFGEADSAEKVSMLRATLGTDALLAFVSDWFSRSLIRPTRGYVHVPAVLVSLIAQWAISDEMMWDLRPCMEFYVEESDAFILPPLREDWVGQQRYQVRNAWQEMEVSLSCQDERYMRLPCRWHEQEAEGSEVRQRELDAQLAEEVNEFEAFLDEEAALERVRITERLSREVSRVRGDVVTGEEMVFDPECSSMDGLTFDEYMTKLWGERWTKRPPEEA